MTVVEIVRQSLQIGRSHKSLWLFAFVVGLGSGGGGGGGGETAGSGGAPGALVAAIVAAALVAIVAGVLMRLVSEGALIEGVSQRIAKKPCRSARVSGSAGRTAACCSASRRSTSWRRW